MKQKATFCKGIEHGVVQNCFKPLGNAELSTYFYAPAIRRMVEGH